MTPHQPPINQVSLQDSVNMGDIIGQQIGNQNIYHSTFQQNVQPCMICGNRNYRLLQDCEHGYCKKLVCENCIHQTAIIKSMLCTKHYNDNRRFLKTFSIMLIIFFSFILIGALFSL